MEIEEVQHGLAVDLKWLVSMKDLFSVTLRLLREELSI